MALALSDSSPSRLDVSWKHSFAVRFAVVWALVLGGAVGISGWHSYRDTERQLMGNLQETVDQDARVMELRLSTWLRSFEEDARSVSRSPVVGEFLKAREGAGEDRWRGMVEDGFRAVFAGKPSYIQMRLLQVGGEDEGQEILRLDRRGEELVVTPREELQQKADRQYFQEALSLPEGEIYFSDINLNRDFGEISRPLIPTIRAAKKIKADNGQKVMLVINADIGDLFRELRNLTSTGSEIFLANESGDFLMHPDEGATFASDLGHETRFQAGEDVGGLSAGRDVAVGHWPERKLHLLVVLKDEIWRPGLESSRGRGIWNTILAALAGAAVALLIAWPFARRLGRLSRALKSFDGKETEVSGTHLEEGKDEIGIAIGRFQEMAAKVGEHVNELHRARRTAEEADAAKENFLAVMSHEIRTPMNAVVGLIRALVENDPPERQRPILSSLRASTANLMTLLNTALDYTRLREGVIQYESVEFDAADIAKEVFAAMKPLALAKNLSLDLESSGALIVKGDPVRFRQVINNLVNNAIKFTAEGGVKVSLQHDGEKLHGQVADSGPGIKEEDREKIFEPFFSREVEANEMAPGAGLGLSVSQAMIEQQGGSMELKCPEEGGAVFSFVLPFKICAEVEGKHLGAAKKMPELLGEPKILYVEDTASNREVMALTLAGTGVKLLCAETAAEGLTKLEEGTFDLVMVDLQLPDLSGAELARRILEKKPTLPVIAVTAQSSARTDGELREAGIVDVVLKPYPKERLLKVLARNLRVGKMKGLAALHPDDPAKLRRLTESMSREFHEAADQLRQSIGREDFEETRRAIRHRLTTALAYLSLGEMEAQFDRAKDGTSKEDVDELIAALEREAGELAK